MKYRAFFISILCLIIMSSPIALRAGVCWYDGVKPVSVGLATEVDPVVTTAIEMFTSDMLEVTGREARMTKPGKATIQLRQLDRMSQSERKKLLEMGVPVDILDTLTDGFNITLNRDKILVTGTNGRGTAYGLLELSRKARVSPWIWWGDVKPEKRSNLTLPDGYTTTQGASVEFRGIFLNDEDWSLRPWATTTFEPNDNGAIGPRTYKEIFKLLMRLRANAVWPAMHPGTEAFFKNPANKLMADSCGIAIGTSHCEPLLRNNPGEWDESERGEYNYITNKDNVQSYWTERLLEVKNSSGGNMFTIGMRGIHDGSMQGVKTTKEKFEALQRVIDDQQQLISDHIGDPSGQMQVFIPYKEVLDLYNLGLKIPEYVTLMWCDDNYGYITRLSDSSEQLRPGGSGVYYHMSYWGRPHDHLWLTTTQPGLIYNEMRNAYDHNARKLWIANVHDPKVAAYDLTLFLDLAWNIHCVSPDNVGAHLKGWLAETFGENTATEIYPAMRKFYELCAKRRPEFMGWSQVELDKKKYHRGLSPVSDTQFSFMEFGSEADRYISEYYEIARAVEKSAKSIRPELADAYFAAITYPVSCAAANATKMLEAQRSRQLANDSTTAADNSDIVRLSAAKSMDAHQKIIDLTDRYNNTMSGGKWRNSMTMSPRDLPFASAPALPVTLSRKDLEALIADDECIRNPHPLEHCDVIALNACDFKTCNGKIKPIDMLGHSGRAIELGKGTSVTYLLDTTNTITSGKLTVALIPTHPMEGDKLRFSVAVDGYAPMEFDLKEPFRSEQWKLNVLRGQALRHIGLPPLPPGKHELTVTALDHHIVLDQLCIDPEPSRQYYLIPTWADNVTK